MVARRPDKKLLKNQNLGSKRGVLSSDGSGRREDQESDSVQTLKMGIPWFDDGLGMKNEGKANISVWSLSSGKDEILMNQDWQEFKRRLEKKGRSSDDRDFRDRLKRTSWSQEGRGVDNDSRYVASATGWIVVSRMEKRTESCLHQ